MAGATACSGRQLRGFWAEADLVAAAGPGEAADLAAEAVSADLAAVPSAAVARVAVGNKEEYSAMLVIESKAAAG